MSRQKWDRGFESLSLRHTGKNKGRRCTQIFRIRNIKSGKIRIGKEFFRFPLFNFDLRLSAIICVPIEFMIAGSCATEGYQPRQVRKEAAAVTAPVCRRGAWLSPPKAAERIEHSAKGWEEIYARRFALCAMHGI